MTSHSSSPSLATDQLQTAIDLAQAISQHPEAHAAFQGVLARVQNQDPELAALLDSLWQAYVASQRSVEFWKQMSQVEKRLSDRITESHVQLKQNYLRLIQEQ